MPKVIKPLTNETIKNAKPRDKEYPLSDGNGLQLTIKPDGSKIWEFRYTSPTTSKRRKTSFGSYPNVSLKVARTKRQEARDKISLGIDIIDEKKEVKEKNILEAEYKKHTFKFVANKWLSKYKKSVSENYHIKIGRALELYIYPFIGKKNIQEITRRETLHILDVLIEEDKVETAHRVFMLLNKVFNYAVTYTYTDINIVLNIDKKNIFNKKIEKHYPTFTEHKDIRGLLLSIDDYIGDYSTKKALQMLPYVFVRSANIRQCEWQEINFKTKEWKIPAEKMKIKDNGDFILPLPNQVIKILEDMYIVSGGGKYVFPSPRGKDNPLSDNTLISALRRMGYSTDELVPHSFRSIFSTIAYEHMEDHTYTSEIIERLLAHKEKNKIKNAYNRAVYKKPMKNLIQWYADFLDNIKN